MTPRLGHVAPQSCIWLAICTPQKLRWPNDVNLQDLDLRKKSKELEFVWRGAKSFGSDADVFTGSFPTGTFEMWCCACICYAALIKETWLQTPHSSHINSRLRPMEDCLNVIAYYISRLMLSQKTDRHSFCLRAQYTSWSIRDHTFLTFGNF